MSECHLLWPAQRIRNIVTHQFFFQGTGRRVGLHISVKLLLKGTFFLIFFFWLVPLWRRIGSDGRNGLTRNSSGAVAADSWRSELQRVADGVKKLPCLSDFWPKPKHDKPPPFICKHPQQQSSSPDQPLCSVMPPCKPSRPACSLNHANVEGNQPFLAEAPLHATNPSRLPARP